MPKGSFDDNMWGQGDPEQDPNDPGQLQANPIVQALMQAQAQQAQQDPMAGKGDYLPVGYQGGLGGPAPTGPAVPAIRPSVPTPADPSVVPPITGPQVTPLGTGGALRGTPDVTQQNTPPPGNPAGAGNPNAPIQPNVVPTTREPPPSIPPPPAPQATGATPEQTTEDSQTTPDRGITSYSPTTEPTGQPSQDSDKPGGRTGKAGGNLRGLGETLATLPPFKPPAPQHISSPAAPRPVHVQHQSQAANMANQIAQRAAIAHSLGMLLRGGR